MPELREVEEAGLDMDDGDLELKEGVMMPGGRCWRCRFLVVTDTDRCPFCGEVLDNDAGLRQAR